MALHPILASPIVTIAAMGGVYLDATYRDLAPRTRLRWTIGVGLSSQVGFLAVFAFDDLFTRAYSLVFGRRLVVHSPYEFLTILFVIGFCISGTGVLIYGVRSRFGPLSARIRS